MSLAIRQALEAALEAITPNFPTSVENGPTYSPVDGVPYQVVNFLFAKPINPFIMSKNYLQKGYMQIDLMYPLGTGTGDATTRAELIRAAFIATLSFEANNVTTLIDGAPEVAPGRQDGTRYKVPVKVRFMANIQGD